MTEEFIVDFKFSTQTGPDSYSQVSAYLPCKGDTTIEDIMDWVKSKSVCVPISITIQKMEGPGE